MSTATVSDKGQVVIPAAIRHRLGIVPGTKLDFELEGDSIRVKPLRRIKPSRPEDGYGLLRCDQPGERRLADFLVSSGHGEALYTFDDRGFARRAQRLGTDTRVTVPGYGQDAAAGAGDSQP